MANINDKSGMRSLVCDSNGIIIAEMVYRCMICSAIHDVLDDAHRHYQIEHIEEGDAIDDAKDGIMRNNLDGNNMSFAAESDLEDEEDLNMSYEMSLTDGSQMFDESFNSGVPNPLTVAVPANLRHLQYQSANSDAMPITQSRDYYNRGKANTYASPANALLLPNDSNVRTVKTASPKRFGGGFVTCEVCGLTKYYSHISRRYGVFSCESCAKFFYRYLLKPSKFTCPSNGNCSLKVDVPGGRCKSCLLQACLQKYVIDPKKHPKIFQRAPQTGEKGELISQVTGVPANVQIKISKPPNKLSMNAPPLKQAIKQEIGIEDIMKGEAFEGTALIAPKNSNTNGIVKQSSKRKQTFGEDGTPQVTRSRRIGCRECPGCLADDCGQCLYCLDKPKFGGNDVKKQRCIKRRCHRANYT